MPGGPWGSASGRARRRGAARDLWASRIGIGRCAVSPVPDPLNAPPLLADLALAGAAVRLRPVRPEDATALFPLIHRVRPVLDWLCWQGPRDAAELTAAYSAWRALGAAGAASGANYHFAVEELSSGAPLGTASLRTLDHPRHGDLGYWLGVPYHGRGFGTELVALLVHLGFDLLRLDALTAEVFPGNTASVRALERSGFRLARPARGVIHGAPVGAPEGASAAGPPDPLRPRDRFLLLPFERAARARGPAVHVSRFETEPWPAVCSPSPGPPAPSVAP